MEDLLFLSHRIPYPPNKGDKIRSFHALKYLSNFYRIHLGAFIDDRRDWRYVDDLQRWCSSVYCRPLDPGKSKLRSLIGLASGEPLTVPYYYDKAMAGWINNEIENNRITRVFVYSSSMAQYVDKVENQDLVKVIDFVDMDSDKWLQYSGLKAFPMSWVYKREGVKLGEYEKRISESFNASLFVSSSEACLFKEKSKSTGFIDYYDNGVDWRYFNPDLVTDNPYGRKEKVIVFCGAMDYWANIDAVKWFAEKVFPLVRSRIREAKFYIVGSRPTEQVLELEKEQGVVVTGAVDDVRPYVKFSNVSIAPLRVARGVQNKVLEALAMGVPVIATSAAADGIDFRNGAEFMIVDEPEKIAEKTCVAINKGMINESSRDWIKERYSWDRNLNRLIQLFERPV